MQPNSGACARRRHPRRQLLHQPAADRQRLQPRTDARRGGDARLGARSAVASSAARGRTRARQVDRPVAAGRSRSPAKRSTPAGAAPEGRRLVALTQPAATDRRRQLHRLRRQPGAGALFPAPASTSHNDRAFTGERRQGGDERARSVNVRYNTDATVEGVQSACSRCTADLVYELRTGPPTGSAASSRRCSSATRSRCAAGPGAAPADADYGARARRTTVIDQPLALIYFAANAAVHRQPCAAPASRVRIGRRLAALRRRPAPPRAKRCFLDFEGGSRRRGRWLRRRRCMPPTGWPRCRRPRAADRQQPVRLGRVPRQCRAGPPSTSTMIWCARCCATRSRRKRWRRGGAGPGPTTYRVVGAAAWRRTSCSRAGSLGGDRRRCRLRQPAASPTWRRNVQTAIEGSGSPPAAAARSNRRRAGGKALTRSRRWRRRVSLPGGDYPLAQPLVIANRRYSNSAEPGPAPSSAPTVSSAHSSSNSAPRFGSVTWRTGRGARLGATWRTSAAR